MKRIATPMIGGVVTSTLMELLVYPAIFFLWRSRRFAKELGTGSEHVEGLPATA
jgi:Cu(I)/Ag(I) efflux system membrane protein CusA/SilA